MQDLAGPRFHRRINHEGHEYVKGGAVERKEGGRGGGKKYKVHTPSARTCATSSPTHTAQLEPKLTLGILSFQRLSTQTCHTTLVPLMLRTHIPLVKAPLTSSSPSWS